MNPLHNVAHLLIGIALLIAGTANASAAKAADTTIGAVYLLLGIVGFFLAANHDSAAVRISGVPTCSQSPSWTRPHRRLVACARA